MSTPFVTFPGTAGNYISTDDVNLLDADTAHCYQSVGGWTIRAQADTLTNETEATASVGGKVLQFLANAPAGQCSVLTETGGNGVAVGGSVAVSAVIRARTLGGVARTGRVVMEYYAAGVFKGQASGSDVALPADGSWVDVAVSGTTHADTDNVLAYLRVTDAVDNETFQIDRSCIRTGSVTSFVRSVRIVGDLDLRARVAADDWTPAAYNRLISRWSAPPDFAWSFAIRTSSDGKLRLDISSDGTAITSLTSTAATGVTDGATAVVKVTRAAASGDTIFYVDDVKLGDTVASAAFGPYVGGEDLTVGVLSNGTTQPFDGDIYWAEVRDGIDGPVVARMDAGDTAKATL